MERKQIEPQKSGFHSEFGSLVGRLASQVSLPVRRRMYGVFARKFPNPQSVLDVGVTSESVAPEANFFEEMFPHKDRITAVGVEDAFHLEEKYPGLRFVKVAPGEKLPFEDQQFEVVFSNAVIEHIVSFEDRLQFLRELRRVGKCVFLTTPNKYFPIEHHTGLPLIHFLSPDLFYRVLENRGNRGFYNRENLQPLDERQLRELMQGLAGNFELIPVRFAGWISNWIVILKS
jgi:SAM-dependent methyltransferase